MSAIQAKYYRYNQSLNKAVKGWVLEHLMRLSPDDRYMRFFSPYNDSALARYVDGIKETDEIFLTMESEGFNTRRFKVTGFLHVAALGDDSFEIGVSVDADQRKNGIAASLFDRAFTFLKARGCKKLYINCLSINTPMQRIVSKYSMTITRDPDDPSTRTACAEMDNSPNVFAWLKGVHQDQIALFDLAFSGAVQGAKQATIDGVDALTNLLKRPEDTP